jgi:hypothetical protein
MHTPTPLCHHIFPDGHRCGSPSMRGETLCYYHHPDRQPVANPYARRARRGFHLAPPTNRRELQHALSQVIQRLAANKLDVRRAGLLLHSLQLVASQFD